MTPMRALSRSPLGLEASIEANKALASSPVMTGVLPVVTICFGPRTSAAGLAGTICRITRKAPKTRKDARCCLIVGAE